MADRYLITGGELISGKGRRMADLIIDHGKIEQIGEDLADAAAKHIDASGRMIFPGFIDAHTHFDLEVSDTVTADDFESGTKAAVAGGTTCIIDFATQYKKETLAEALDIWHRKADGVCSSDYAFHMAISDWNEHTAEEVREMFASGVTSFKLYMTYDIRVSDGVMFDVLKRMKSLGGIVGVHCENHDLINRLVGEQKLKGNYSPAAHPKSRPACVEAEAIHRLLTIARVVDVPVMIVHLSSAEGYEEICRARARGQRVYVETCPQYLIFDESRYELEDFEGAKYVCSPPLRSRADKDCLWKAISEGQIDTISTDHCSFTMAQKRMGLKDFTKIPNGMPGVMHRPHLMYTYGVLEERMTLEQMCLLLSENPARLYGMYPRKGCLAEGSDADIVIWNPLYRRTITAEGQLYKTDFNPYEGIKVRGMAEKVFLRGQLVAEIGEITKPHTGCFIRRDKSGF